MKNLLLILTTALASLVANAGDSSLIQSAKYTNKLMTGVGSISGTIIDSDTGIGLSDERVWIYDSSGRPVTINSVVQTAVTDINGNYTSIALDEGDYYIRTRNTSGYIDKLYEGIDCHIDCNVLDGTAVTISNTSISGIDFSLEKGTVFSGRVTDSMTGLGINNVRILVYDSFSNYVAAGYTDQNGDYQTRSGVMIGAYYVQAIVFGSSIYASQIYDDIPCYIFNCNVAAGQPITVNNIDTITGIDFELDEGNRIFGRVVDETSGMGIQGIQIDVYSITQSIVTLTFTDINGYYKSPNLEAGDYYLRTRNSIGYIDELYNNISCGYGCYSPGGEAISILSSHVTGVDFSLDIGAVFTGRITESQTGNGINNVGVSIYNSSGGYVTGAFPDNNGDFQTKAGVSTGIFYAKTFNYFNANNYVNEVFDDIQCEINCDVTTGQALEITSTSPFPGVNFILDKPDQIFKSGFE